METVASAAVPQAETTQDERTMAVLAQALQVVGGWIAPLVIFFVKRESRFVSFHALQVLFLELIYILFSVCLMVFWFTTIALSFFRAHSGDTHNLPVAFFAVFPLLWLGIMGMWVFKIVVAVIYSIKAGRGEWAEYPVLGGWARRALKIGPGGVPLP